MTRAGPCMSIPNVLWAPARATPVSTASPPATYTSHPVYMFHREDTHRNCMSSNAQRASHRKQHHDLLVGLQRTLGQAENLGKCPRPKQRLVQDLPDLRKQVPKWPRSLLESWRRMEVKPRVHAQGGQQGHSLFQCCKGPIFHRSATCQGVRVLMGLHSPRGKHQSIGWVLITPVPAPPTKLKAAWRGGLGVGTDPWHPSTAPRFGKMATFASAPLLCKAAAPGVNTVAPGAAPFAMALRSAARRRAASKVASSRTRWTPVLPRGTSSSASATSGLTVTRSCPCKSRESGAYFDAGSPRSTVAPAPKRGLDVSPAAFKPPEAFRGPWSELNMILITHFF